MVVVGAAADDKDGQLLKPSSNRLEVNASEPSEQPVAQQPVLDSVEGTSRGSVACMLTDLLTEPSWHAALSSEFAKAYFGRLQEFVQSERAVHQVFPPEDQVFRAFNSCPFDQVAGGVMLRPGGRPLLAGTACYQGATPLGPQLLRQTIPVLLRLRWSSSGRTPTTSPATRAG